MSSRKNADMHNADAAWTPLRQAVFDNYWENELEGGANQIDLSYSKYNNAPNSIEIHPPSQTFKYVFRDGSVVEGAPWDLLTRDRLYPRNALLAVAMHNSTQAIWDMMRKVFNRKVATDRISLFARPHTFRAPFASIPSDHWSLYRVTDWENGAAVAQDGSLLFSIHAKVVVNAGATAAGRKPTFDPHLINAKVLGAFRQKGPLDRNGEDGWRGRADVERLIRDCCLDTTGTEPARSTLQRLANDAIAAASKKIKTHN